VTSVTLRGWRVSLHAGSMRDRRSCCGGRSRSWALGGISTPVSALGSDCSSRSGSLCLSGHAVMATTRSRLSIARPFPSSSPGCGAARRCSMSRPVRPRVSSTSGNRHGDHGILLTRRPLPRQSLTRSLLTSIRSCRPTRPLPPTTRSLSRPAPSGTQAVEGPTPWRHSHRHCAQVFLRAHR